MVRNALVASGVVAVACCLGRAAQATEPATQPTGAPASQPASAGVTQPAGIKSLLDFRELSLDLGFEGGYDHRAVSFDVRDPFRSTQRQTDRSRSFEETVGLRSAGSVLDERILLFDLAASWGLAQQWFAETRPGPDLSESPHGDLLQYDMSFTALPRGVVSANGFAQQLDSRVPRAFLPSLDRTMERYGGGVFLNDATLPMRFTFEHVWDELTSRTGNLLDDEQRGHDTFRYEGTWQISKYHSLQLEYEYSDLAERYSGTRTRFDTTRNYLALNHMLRFGPNANSSWETLARFQNETGALGRDLAEISTRLRLQHTDAFSTNFAAQFLRESFQELGTGTWRGEGGLTYQPSKDLTTSLQMYGLQQSADENADVDEWGGLANVGFSRDNALGRFSTNVSYSHATTTTRNGDQRGVVIGESVTFRDPLPVYLAHTDVDLWSLVVTDGSRTRTFLPVRDYVSVRLGHYTALQRVPTGAIADRQTVLVTYTYKVYDDFAVQRDRLDVRLQQDFKFGLTPYYAGSLQNEDLDNPRYVAYRDRDVNRHRLGATYRQKLWSVGGEYEYNDDAIEPYQALHGNGDVVLWRNARQQLDGKGTLSHFWFEGAEDTLSHFWFEGAEDTLAHDTTLLDLGLSYRCLLAERLEANTSAMYRYEDDSRNGLTNGVDVRASLDWKLGLFALRFEAEYELLDLPGSGDQSASFWIKLKRDIPLIAKEPR